MLREKNMAHPIDQEPYLGQPYSLNFRYIGMPKNSPTLFSHPNSPHPRHTIKTEKTISCLFWCLIDFFNLGPVVLFPFLKIFELKFESSIPFQASKNEIKKIKITFLNRLMPIVKGECV